MPLNFPYLGQTLALLSALLWAFAVILFKKSGENLHPIALNIFKNLVALLLLLPTMAIFHETIFRPVQLREYALFILSGLLGMAIGDTLFFFSLNRIGASISAIVGYMYSPSIILLSLLFLKETLSLPQTIGTVLILAALITTTRIELPGSLTRKALLTGIIWGVLSTLATGIGVVIVKPILATTPLLWATGLRLLAGLLGLVIITVFLPNRKKIIRSLFNRKNLGYPFAGTILGTYLALTVWLGGMKFTRVSIAAPLNQLTNIFIFILAAIILKEPITPRKLLAIVIAFAGALLVFLS